MPRPSLDDLTTPMTVDEVKTSLYGVLARVGVSTTGWKTGAVVRTIIAAVAVLGAAMTRLAALIARSGFLELSSGVWLELVAWYVFGVEKVKATAAVGQVTLTNAGGGVYHFDAEDLVVTNPTTKKSYRNVAAFDLTALSSATVDIRAIEVGTDSNAPAGSITKLETALNGVTVTNALAVVGLDDESDPILRTRCYEKQSSLSPNGPRDAYAYFARSAKRADGSSVGVTRVRVSASSTTGHVTVTVAGATGAIPGTWNDPATDLGAVWQSIAMNVVPDGVTFTLQTASAHAISVTAQAWIYTTSSLSEAQAQALIVAKVTSFIVGQPIGGNVIAPSPAGYVYADAIRAAVGATTDQGGNALPIFHAVVTLPSVDVAIGTAEVPTAGTVSVVVHLEEP